MPDKPAQSARGLFSATGNKRRDIVVQDAATGELVRSGGGLPRALADFYPTPPEPTLALLKAEAKAIDLWAREGVWEPAVGNGAMARIIEMAGYEVYASDIVDRGFPFTQVRDFFDYRKAPAQCLITNPPFNLVNWRDGQGRWIEHAIDLLGIGYMALLLPWTWPAAAGLQGLWHRFPPQRVYLMRWKIDFTGQGQAPMNNGWFVWDLSARHIPTQLLMLDKADVLQGEMAL
jgi:hypothetical protein